MSTVLEHKRSLKRARETCTCGHARICHSTTGSNGCQYENTVERKRCSCKRFQSSPLGPDKKPEEEPQFVAGEELLYYTGNGDLPVFFVERYHSDRANVKGRCPACAHLEDPHIFQVRLSQLRKKAPLLQNGELCLLTSEPSKSHPHVVQFIEYSGIAARVKNVGGETNSDYFFVDPRRLQPLVKDVVSRLTRDLR